MKPFAFKIFITAVFSFLNVNMATSQIHFGVKIGYSRSKTAKEFTEKYHNSIVGGLVAGYDINDAFALRGDLTYSTRGYYTRDGVLDEGTLKDVRIKFHYINLPVLLEYKPVPFLAIEAGPSFGLQVKRAAYYDNIRQDNVAFGNKQPFDFGGIIGVKGMYKNVFIELQYMHGFTSAYRKVHDFKANGISINLGYMFI